MIVCLTIVQAVFRVLLILAHIYSLFWFQIIGHFVNRIEYNRPLIVKAYVLKTLNMFWLINNVKE